MKSCLFLILGLCPMLLGAFQANAKDRTRLNIYSRIGKQSILGELKSSSSDSGQGALGPIDVGVQYLQGRRLFELGPKIRFPSDWQSRHSITIEGSLDWVFY